MWFIYALIYTLFLALVNYLDEYLTTKSDVPESADLHTKIGGLLLISTILTGLGAISISFVEKSLALGDMAFVISLLSAIPMVIMLASYFYLLNKYPAHQVVPLFLLSSGWLLLFEILSGATVTTFGLLGMVLLIFGAYILDADGLKWQIPSKFLFITIPAHLSWAVTLFMVHEATELGATPLAVTFWQFFATAVIGLLLMVLIRKYREGLMFRLRNEKKFLWLSLLNEGFSQGGFAFGFLAVAAAPLAAYVTAMSGVQSVFLLVLFYLCPIDGERSRITKSQIAAILLIALGVYLIEGLPGN